MANNSINDYEQLKRRNRRRLIGAVVLVFIAIIILWKAISFTPEQTTNTNTIIINDQVSDTIIEPDLNISSDPIVPFASEPIISELDVVSEITEFEHTFEGNIETATEPTRTPPDTITPEPSTTIIPPKKIAEKKPAEKKSIDKKPPVVITPPKVHNRPRPEDILEGKVVFNEIGPETANASSSEKVVIQVAALSDSAQAAQVKSKLASMGISASISKANTSKGEMNRVRVGPFSNRDEAEKTLDRLKASGMSGIIVTQ